MATTTSYVPPSGYGKGSFQVDPEDGYYIAGLTVVDGYIVDATVKSTELLFSASGVPEGFVVPSGSFTGDATHYVTYN